MRRVSFTPLLNYILKWDRSSLIAFLSEMEIRATPTNHKQSTAYTTTIVASCLAIIILLLFEWITVHSMLKLPLKALRTGKKKRKISIFDFHYHSIILIMLLGLIHVSYSVIYITRHHRFTLFAV